VKYRIAGLFCRRKPREFRISVAICRSFIHENQPGIDFGQHDILGRPMLLCAYPPTTVLMMASFQCADSKPVGPLSTTIPVLTIMAANKEMKQVVDGTAGGRTLLTSKRGAYLRNTSLPKRRHRYSSKRAGYLELWTSPRSSVTCAFLSRSKTRRPC